jgi:serine/threonine-protein kinase
VDRRGGEYPIAAPARQYTYPRISPDGTRLVLDVRDGGPADIWVWDFTRSTLSRLTQDPAGDHPIPN